MNIRRDNSEEAADVGSIARLASVPFPVGHAIRLLPRRPMDGLATKAMRVMARRHADVFRRLAELHDRAFLIDPVDLPVCFLIRPGLPAPQMTVVDREPKSPAAATIRGNLGALLALLEGRVDGDALFFSGSLSVEGDIEAVLMLRNALDGAEIDICRDLASAFGPAAGLLERMLGLSVTAAERAAGIAASLQVGLTAPVRRVVQTQDVALAGLRRDLLELSRQLKELRPRHAN